MSRPPARKRAPATPARERDRERTRAQILEAARRSFATRGYAQSGVREIAAEAGITPALVVRYFGSKQKLFLAAVEADLGLEPFLAGARTAIGRHIVDHLIEKQPPEADSIAILLLGAADPTLTGALKRLVHQRLLAPLSEWLGGRDAEARAALLLALVSGAWMYRRLLPLAPLAGDMDGAAADTLAAMLQALVDAPAPTGRPPTAKAEAAARKPRARGR